MLLMDDITDIIRLGEEARHAERHLASVIESASDIVLSMRPSGEILTWNTAAVNISGFEEREVRDRNLCDLCVESQRRLLAQALRRVRQPGCTERVEVELTGRDGALIPIAWVFSAMRDVEGRLIAVVAVGRDLTERRKFEAQLLQTEKLAALGVMAGGIAHELRNPLAVVSSAVQLLIGKSLAPEVADECLERIFRGAQRMAGIIENLLSFARPSDKGRKTDLDLVAVVREAVAMTNNPADAERVEVQIKSPNTPVPIHGNACLLQQLVTNLVTNSVNALGESGGHIAVTLTMTREHALLFVTDSGCGIRAEHLDKVFDPFFTAMPIGRGTGLGLSICHTIVQQHEGKIEIASLEGKGTTVKVILPLLQKV
jgi:PAS domain S-box-containing protein